MNKNVINEVLKETAKKCAEANPTNSGDYKNEQGLLICGKCNKPKECEITFPEKRIVPAICDCVKAQEEKEKAKQKRVETQTKIERVRKEAFSDSGLLKYTFANDDMENETVTKVMKNYVNNFAELLKMGQGLLLYGETGRGKTFYACEVANELIDKGYRVLVRNFAEILNTLQSTYDKQGYINNIKSVDLLVVDDLGVERETAFAKEQVYNIIDSRYRAGLPTVITTNLALDKIKSPEDIENKRIYERVLEKCTPIEVKGINRRRKAVREKHDNIKALLGLE